MIEIRRNPKPVQITQEAPLCPVNGQAAAQTIEYTHNAQNAQKRPLQPFTALDGSNYRTAYRAICEFHERHNPPRLDDDDGGAYWNSVTEDAVATANALNNDPFATAMIADVLDELEREFKTLQHQAQRQAN